MADEKLYIQVHSDGLYMYYIGGELRWALIRVICKLHLKLLYRLVLTYVVVHDSYTGTRISLLVINMWADDNVTSILVLISN